MKYLFHLLLTEFAAAIPQSNMFQRSSTRIHRLSNLLPATDKAHSAGWDIRHAGPFQTLGCGAYHNGNLAIILNQLITDLVPIIQDAKDSATTPSAAYSIFFKNPKNAPFVAEILTNVSTGAIMRPPVANSSTGGPTIVCPKPGRSFHIELPRGATIDAAVYCASRGASVAAYLNPTPIIMLCPNFFTRVAGPPTPVVGICPKFNQATNRFKRLSTDGTVDGASVVHSQMWVLLEEMVHYYIVTSRVKRNSPEAYDINKAWLLSARKSLGNAVSYGYYAACRSSWFLNSTLIDPCLSYCCTGWNIC